MKFETFRQNIFLPIFILVQVNEGSLNLSNLRKSNDGASNLLLPKEIRKMSRNGQRIFGGIQALKSMQTFFNMGIRIHHTIIETFFRLLAFHCVNSSTRNGI